MSIAYRAFSRFRDIVMQIAIDRSIRHVRYVHFMQLDKFAPSYLAFLRDHYDMSQHLVLIKGAPGCALPFKMRNVYRVNYFFRWLFLYRPFVNYKVKSVRKFIFHSLFDYEVVKYFSRESELLRQKGWWFIYGADLYTPPNDRDNVFVRSNVKGIITDTDGDDIVMMKKYSCHPSVIRAGYAFPVSWSMIETAVRERPAHDYVRVQINNSCDGSIIPALETLARFRDQNIKVRVILSYGKFDKEKVRAVGQSIFGDKFEPIDEFLAPAEYAKKMAENDILILNHNRQQGLGNCFAALACGVKLFIRSEVTTSAHLKSKGCSVYATEDLSSLSWETFVSYPESDRLASRTNSRRFFDDSYLKSLWDPVFS